MHQISQHNKSHTHTHIPTLTSHTLTSLFIRHMLRFARSIPIAIYTLSSHAPTQHYLHTFLCLFAHSTHHLRVTQIVLDIQQHRCGCQLAPILGNNTLSMAQTSQHANPVSCQRSAVSCRSFCPRLWNVSSLPTTPLFTSFEYGCYY